MKKKMRIIFWGIGGTAQKKLCQIQNLSDQIKIVAFTDSCLNENEKGLLWEGYELVLPQKICQLEIDYLCILSIWEDQIRERIFNEKLFEPSRILSFHELCLMDIFKKEDIDECYNCMIACMPLRQIRVVEEWRVYEYLKKSYSYVLFDCKYYRTNKRKKVYFATNIRPIWVVWLQGYEQAPVVVEVCIHSLKRVLKKEERICILDEKKIFEYIDLPEYIIHKWKRGIISNAHFCDIVRVVLLNIYGGIWVDATVYFTDDKLLNQIKYSKLFMFSRWTNWKVRTEPKIAANWLISAESNNKMLLVLEALYYEYWKKENKLINYYLFHIFWTLIAERFPDEWNEVEKVLRDPAQLLNNELFNKYDDKRYEYLKSISSVHKLSYKKEYRKGRKDSFWTKICEFEEVFDEGYKYIEQN